LWMTGRNRLTDVSCPSAGTVGEFPSAADPTGSGRDGSTRWAESWVAGDQGEFAESIHCRSRLFFCPTLAAFPQESGRSPSRPPEGARRVAAVSTDVRTFPSPLLLGSRRDEGDQDHEDPDGREDEQHHEPKGEHHGGPPSILRFSIRDVKVHNSINRSARHLVARQAGSAPERSPCRPRLPDGSPQPFRPVGSPDRRRAGESGVAEVFPVGAATRHGDSPENLRRSWNNWPPRRLYMG
jgi:hypothetical protein